MRTFAAGLALLLAMNIIFAFSIIAIDAAVPPAIMHARIATLAATGQIDKNYVLSPVGQPLDWFSDCVAMSLNAFGPMGRSPVAQLRDADIVVNADGPGAPAAPCSALSQARTTNVPPMLLQYYFRYWHGYQLITKPSLLWLDLPQLRSLLDVLYIVTLAAFFVLTVPHRRVLDGMFLAACFILLTDAANPANPMVHSIALLASFAGGIGVRLTAARHDLRVVFLVGVAAAAIVGYVDLILVAPLSAVILMFAGTSGQLWSGQRPVAQLARTFAAMLVAWCLGYFGTMALRVAVSALLLPDPFEGLRNFVGLLRLRLNGDVPAVLPTRGFATASVMNLKALGASLFLWPAVAGAAAIAIARLIRGWRYHSPTSTLACTAIAVLPFLWFETFSNHSEIHYIFIYRALAFSFCMLVASVLCTLVPTRGRTLT